MLMKKQSGPATVDPRAARLLAMRKPRGNTVTPATESGAVKCGVCGRVVKRNEVCKRCYPDLVPEIPSTAQENAPDPRSGVCFTCNGRLNEWNGKCARCSPRASGTAFVAGGEKMQLNEERPTVDQIRDRLGIGKTVDEAGDPKDGNIDLEVKAAIETIKARGEFPSARKIQEEIGHGNIQSIMDAKTRLVASGAVTLHLKTSHPLPPIFDHVHVNWIDELRKETSIEKESLSPVPCSIGDPELAVIGRFIALPREAQQRVITYLTARV